MYSLISVSTEEEPALFFFSSAHCSFAPSIWRRLLMQAFFCAVVRAFTKLGMAIAARRPMIATTIMISTSVKPALRLVLLMFMLFYVRREQDRWRVINSADWRSQIATDQ